MKIKSFEIIDFKNISYAKCDDLPDFVVLCGANGCGKSSILQAFIAAKEILSGFGTQHYYGQFNISENLISSNKNISIVRLTIEFSLDEIEIIKKHVTPPDIPAVISFEISIHRPTYNIPDYSLLKYQPAEWIRPNGYQSVILSIGSDVISPMAAIHDLFSLLSETKKSEFDYFGAHRQNNENNLNSWQPDYQNINQYKQLLSNGNNKYQYIKQYLVEMKLRYAESALQEVKAGKKLDEVKNPLDDIRQFFSNYFDPMKFVNVDLTKNPFKFIISTPKGQIDIDNLSSGEKEILSTYVYFYHLGLTDSVILFDEPDAHLHPALARKYIKILRDIRGSNQFIISSHSPELMDEAGHDALFTVIKHPEGSGVNQFVRVSTTADKHEAIYNVMGSKGFVSFNKKIIFVEGKTDVDIYEAFFPSDKNNVSFVRAGDCRNVQDTLDRVCDLLEQGVPYQQFHGIIDGDYRLLISRPEVANSRIISLPVYHVENFLLDETLIFESSKILLREKMPFASIADVKAELIRLLTEEVHFQAFQDKVNAYKDNIIVDAVKHIARKSRFSLDVLTPENIQTRISDSGHSLHIDAKALLGEIIDRNEWRQKCIGRVLLNQYLDSLHRNCRVNIHYTVFKNKLLNEMRTPPAQMVEALAPIGISSC